MEKGRTRRRPNELGLIAKTSSSSQSAARPASRSTRNSNALSQRSGPAFVNSSCDDPCFVRLTALKLSCAAGHACHRQSGAAGAAFVRRLRRARAMSAGVPPATL
jgi:hypothetical protein